MEIKNCEQYVLAELEAVTNERDRLLLRVEQLEAQCELLDECSKPSRLEAYITEQGRRTMFGLCTGYRSAVRDDDGEPVPFELWCENGIRAYNMPKWLSKTEFIREFEPELRKAYEEAIEDEENE